MKYILPLITVFLVGCGTKLPYTIDDEFLSDIFPSNSYKITQKRSTTIVDLTRDVYTIDKVLLLRNNLDIRGNGSRILIDNTEADYSLKMQGLHNVTLRDLTIASSNDAKSISHAVVGIINSNNITLESLRIDSFNRTAIKVSDSDYIEMDSISITNLNPSTSGNVDGIFVGGYHSSKRIVIKNSNFTDIGRKDFRSNGFPDDGDGIQIQGAPKSSIEDISIINCTFTNCTSRAIKIQSGDSIIIRSNKIDSCRIGVSFALAEISRSIYLEANDISHCENAISTYSNKKDLFISGVSINNNKIFGCDYFLRNGLRIDNFKISKNKADSLGKSFIVGEFINGEISKNIVNDFGSKNPSFDMGLHLVKNTANILIQDNIFNSCNSSKRTILLEQTIRNITIDRNQFQTNSTRPIQYDNTRTGIVIGKNTTIKLNQDKK